MAWLLVRHALTMIFRNIGPALQASVGPILIAMAISFGVVLAVDLNPVALVSLITDPRQVEAVAATGSVPLLLGILFLMLVYAFVFAWICVAWHRFILLEEAPGTLPAITGRPIWLYVGTTVLLALLLLLLAIPLGLVLSIFAAPFVGEAGSPTAKTVSVVFSVLIDVVLTYLWFRFAVVLPAAAIGRPLTLGDGWTASGRIAGAIFGAVLIFIALSFVVGLAVGWLAGHSIWLGLLASLALQWVTLMMGASILTTIYGVGVERRSL